MNNLQTPTETHDVKGIVLCTFLQNIDNDGTENNTTITPNSIKL